VIISQKLVDTNTLNGVSLGSPAGIPLEESLSLRSNDEI